MYTLKVNTSKVNIRNTPVVDTTYSNWAGDLSPGETHLAQEILADAQGRLWWKDTLNRFTIASASDVVTFQDPAAGTSLVGVSNYLQERFSAGTINGMIDYSAIASVPDSLKNNRGRGIKVAILDHAIPTGIQFINPVIRPFPGIVPADAHGAFIAGLIAASTGPLAGLAPEVQLIELPIRDADGFRQQSLLDKAMAWLATQPGPIIVNCSQDLTGLNHAQLLTLPHIFLIASAGVDKDLTGAALIPPASGSNSISVGAISDSYLNKEPNPAFNTRLDLFLTNFNYVSLDRPTPAGPAYTVGSGDSYATAIVSGMAALLLKDQPALSSVATLRNQLAAHARSFADKSFFQFLNPIKPS